MRIGDLSFDGKAILAPMAGVTDSPFRILCREAGAAMVSTEMISAQGLARGASRTLRYLSHSEEERPIAIQIYGQDAATMESGAVEAMKWKPDVLDLNFGCPVRKVVRNGAGSALMKDLQMLESIARAVVRASSVPVTAKIRSGWDERHINAVDASKRLEDAGISAVSVHPRTRQQQFSGKANWEVVARVVEAVEMTIIGNGDVFTPKDAEDYMAETGCDAVMIGRGAIGRPWIFDKINNYLESGKSSDSPDNAYRFTLLDRFIDMETTLRGELFAIYQIRRMLPWFISGMPHRKRALDRFMVIRDLSELRAVIKEYSDSVIEAELRSEWELEDIEEEELEEEAIA